MKKISLALLALGFLSINFQSCTTDPCKDVSCSGNGTTIPSADNKSCSCNCQSGYTGTSCNQVDLTKLAGDYQAIDIDSRNKKDTYNIKINVTGNSLLINNFGNVFSNNVVISNVEGTSMSIISASDVRGQKPDANINYYVKTTENGSIKFVNGSPVVTFIYQITSPTGTLSTYNCTYTKK